MSTIVQRGSLTYIHSLIDEDCWAADEIGFDPAACHSILVDWQVAAGDKPVALHHYIHDQAVGDRPITECYGVYIILPLLAQKNEFTGKHAAVTIHRILKLPAVCRPTGTNVYCIVQSKVILAKKCKYIKRKCKQTMIV